MIVMRRTMAWLAIAALSAAACGGDETGSGGGGAGGGGAPGAAHTPLPQVVSLGGKVLASPKVQPILYASDPHLADVTAFLAELASSPYFETVTKEYGVGPLTVRPMITRPEAPPATISSSALAEALGASTGEGAPWGPIDADTVFVFLLPEGTIIEAEGPCCLDFDGFHDEASVNGVDVPYAVVCSCPGFDGPDITDVQQITVAMSHEIVEASTNPHVWTNPAFAQTDDASMIWTLVAGGEVADLCTFDPDAYAIPDGSTFMVQRSWSNAAAKAGKDPCLPAPAGTFAGAAPVMTDAITLKDVPFTTKGVKIPIGQSRTIDVQLWSDPPTDEPWDVEAVDFNHFFGGPANLSLSLDKSRGADGDVLHLTIQALSKDATLGGEAFFVISQRGGSSSLFIGAVGN